MSERYDPPEDQIERVLEQSDRDSRKLAIAYLRARKKAQDNEAAFRAMDGVAGAMAGLMQGDVKATEDSLRGIRRTMALHEDIAASRKATDS